MLRDRPAEIKNQRPSQRLIRTVVLSDDACQQKISRIGRCCRTTSSPDHFQSNRGDTTAPASNQLGLVKTLAVSLAPHRIRVNAVSPGWIATEMTGLQQQHDEFNRYIKSRVPLGRWGTTEEFEGIAVYLASDASAFTTGAEIRIDGGFSVY